MRFQHQLKMENYGVDETAGKSVPEYPYRMRKTQGTLVTSAKDTPSEEDKQVR